MNTESRIEVFHKKKKLKKTLALKWATSNFTMLGIKADSVPFPLRKKEIGKKQLIVVRLSTLFISLSNEDADQISDNIFESIRISQNLSLALQIRKKT